MEKLKKKTIFKYSRTRRSSVKKNIGRFKNNTKLKGTSSLLCGCLQQNSQQKALGLIYLINVILEHVH